MTDRDTVIEALKLLGIDSLEDLESLEDLAARVGRVVPEAVGELGLKVQELDTDYDLLFITCSKMKAGEPGDQLPLPVIVRYDGPKYRTLRKYLRIMSGASKEEPFNLEMIPDWLEIRCLSGWYGLLPPDDMTVPYYDSEGVMRRGLQGNIIYRLKELKDERGSPGCILVVGGLRAYKVSFKNMELFMGCKPRNLEIVSKGPGLQMRAMIDWLRARCVVREGRAPW